jgi:general stress protein YciG
LGLKRQVKQLVKPLLVEFNNLPTPFSTCFFMESTQATPRQVPAASTATKAEPKTMRPAARVGDGNRRRGFASMDPALQRRLAVEGGKASHVSGRGHKWTAEEAREAGRKGGLISRRKPGANNSK